MWSGSVTGGRCTGKPRTNRSKTPCAPNATTHRSGVGAKNLSPLQGTACVPQQPDTLCSSQRPPGRLPPSTVPFPNQAHCTGAHGAPYEKTTRYGSTSRRVRRAHQSTTSREKDKGARATPLHPDSLHPPLLRGCIESTPCCWNQSDAGASGVACLRWNVTKRKQC